MSCCCCDNITVSVPADMGGKHMYAFHWERNFSKLFISITQSTESAISPFTLLHEHRPSQFFKVCANVQYHKDSACLYSDLVDTCKRQTDSERNMQMCINTNRWSLYGNNSCLTAQISKNGIQEWNMHSHQTKRILRFAVVEHKVHSFLAVKLNVSWKLPMGFGIYAHWEARVPLLPSSTSSTASCFKIQSIISAPNHILSLFLQ